MGKNYLVTHHDDPIQAIVHTWDLCQRDQRYIKFGSDYLLYKLCDEAVRQFMPVVTEIDDEIDRAEDEIFDQPTTETLESIFQLKRSVLKLRRAIGPLNEQRLLLLEEILRTLIFGMDFLKMKLL